MAKQVINIGTSEQSGDGETLRSALDKANDNFTELYAADAGFDGKFASLTETPTTIAGYGITDAATSAQGTKADNALQPTGISVSTLANAGSGTLTYVGDQAPNTGVLTYTPPDLSGLVSSNTTQVSIGDNAGATSQGTKSVAIGSQAGSTSQGNFTVAVGDRAGLTGQGAGGVGIGIEAGKTTQGVEATAVGAASGKTSQGENATAIGSYAGNISQGISAVAVGDRAGSTSQGANTVAVGAFAGEDNQGSNSVAIGNEAGETTQGSTATAVGNKAGETNQGEDATAIGAGAGVTNQGANALAIGVGAGTTNQAANSIVINATSGVLENTTASSLVIKPIRNASGTHALEYNPTTGEVTYDTAGGGAADTDGLSEGTTNLYYTDARADARAQIKIDALVDTAPGTMDTLNELAAALGDDPNFATTTATSIAEKLPLAGGTMTGDIDGAGNKVLFANMYATEGDLPSATTYHGMFAHVHATGAGYFAHGGNWIRLANQSELGGGGGGSTWAGITDINNISGPTEVAIGKYAGTSQGNNAIAIGNEAGQSGQGTNAVAIGWQAGESAQSSGAVAYGQYAGQTSQSGNAVAIGQGAGNHQQGGNAIAIGQNAGAVSQAANSIVLNAASGTLNNTVANSFVVKPIRNASGTHSMEYNPTTGEVTYDTLGGGGGGLSNVVDDTSPQLGGNLDVNSHNINLPDSSRIVIGSGNDSTLRWDAGDNEARYEATGDIQLAPSGRLQFNTGGSDRWQVTSAGHIIPEADTAYDIGNASNKVRHFYLSDSSIKWGAAELPMTVVDSRLHFNSIKVLTETSTTDTNINVSGAGLGIKIGQSSTSGSTISIGSEVNTTTVSMNGLTDFNARATFDRGVAERFYTITGATGTVTHNCQWGHIWYHTGAAADFTANITNLALAQEDVTNVAVVINQGGTGYIPNAVQIGGVAQTIVWQGNSAPTATANGVDTFSFTIMNDGGTYMVLGQMTSFGGV